MYLKPLLRLPCHHESHRGPHLPDCRETYLCGGAVTLGEQSHVILDVRNFQLGWVGSWYKAAGALMK